MIADAWILPTQSFHGCEAMEEITHSFSILLEADEVNHWKSSLRGWVGIATIQRLLQNTQEGNGDVWTGPFVYDLFAGADTKLERRAARLGSYDKQGSLLYGLNATHHSSQHDMTVGVVSATDPARSNGTLSSPMPSAMINAKLTFSETGKEITAHQFIHLIFESLRVPVWINHDAEDFVATIYPIGITFELAKIDDIGLSIRFLQDEIKDQLITFGDLHQVLYAILCDAIEIPAHVAEGKVKAAPAEGGVPIIQVSFTRSGAAATTALSANGTRFRETNAQAELERNTTIIVS